VLKVNSSGAAAAADDDDRLYYDAEWMAVLKKTNHLLSTMERKSHYRNIGDFSVDEAAIAEIVEIFEGDLKIPLNFKVDPKLVHDPAENSSQPAQAVLRTNAQTTELCGKLEINDPIILVQGGDNTAYHSQLNISSASYITADDGCNDDTFTSNVTSNVDVSANPDEIDLDDDDDDDDDDEEKEETTDDDLTSSRSLFTSTPLVAANHDSRRHAVSSTPTMSLPSPKLPRSKRFQEFLRQEEWCNDLAGEESGEELEKSFSLDSKATATVEVVAGEEEEEPVVGTPVSKKKKFKRRNADIYANLASDSD